MRGVCVCVVEPNLFLIHYITKKMILKFSYQNIFQYTIVIYLFLLHIKKFYQRL